MAKSKKGGPAPLFAGRLARCRRQMKKHKIGAFLISKERDYFYLLGFTGEDSAIMVTPKVVHVLSDGRFDETINLECPWVTRWMRRGTLNAEIAKACKELKIKSLAIQGDRLTVADQTELRKANRGTKLVEAPDILGEMRLKKDETELAQICKSIRNAEEAFKIARAAIKVGQTESEIAARIEYEMKRRGASGPSFPTICAVGARGALPHAEPGNRKVKRGSAILIDWGARLGNYCSDLTRMVFVGSIPRKIGEIYPIVLEAQLRAIAAIRPGKRMCDIDEVARGYIRDAGYGEAFGHGLGHGMGLDIHEAPSLSWRSDAKLAAGMVVTVEPGIYLPGIGGVRIEDDIIVTPTGSRVLTRLSKRIEDAVI